MGGRAPMRRRNPIGGQNPSAHARITPDRLCAASKSAAGTRDAGPLESGHTTASVVATDDRQIGAAEQGIAEMMVDLYLSFAEPLSDEMLFTWHRMLVKGRKDLKDLGRYRRSDEAMQVVSSAPYAPNSLWQKYNSWDNCFMAMGRRSGRQHQQQFWIAAADVPRTVAHPFYQRLHALLDEHGFDAFVESRCEQFYAPKMGRPSLPPGLSGPASFESARIGMINVWIRSSRAYPPSGSL